MRLEKGRVISKRYKILDVIGKGGMAIVYKANDIKLGRDVTFKVLKEDYIDDEAFINRFTTEARAAAQLAHTNIVNVYDVGNEGDIHYIVMEYIDGYTLKELIYKKAPLSNKLACDIAMQIAAGLDNAHAHGVIHRDIKPENILLTEINGRLVAKVTDFGIAKANFMENTQGEYMGSIHYFSPEQAKGENVDNRSDIYSLGIVLYEMITGERPFEGDSAFDLAMKHIKSPLPDPKIYNPNVTQDIVDIIKKACAKEARNRYQDAQDMEQALKDISSFDSKNKEGVSSERKSVPHIEEYDNEYEDDYDDYEDSESNDIKKRERNVVISAIVVGIVLILFITFGGSALTKTFYGDSVKIPNFVGMSYERACKKAERKGLTIERQEVYSADVDTGDVAQQTPESGERVQKGTTVILYVSYGQGDIQVPGIEGMSRENAKSVLEEMGLTMGNVEYVNSDKPIGEIVEQSPKEGEMVTADTTIDVKVSQGGISEEVKVPDLKMQKQEDVEKLLTEIGLGFKFIDGYSDTVPEGSVIEQGIAPDTTVAKGSQITITISRGKSENLVDEEKTTVEPIIDIEPVTQPPTEPATKANDSGKLVSISVNPDSSILKDTNNTAKVVANKGGVERVISEKTLSKNDFPYSVNDNSDGNTEYSVYINGEVIERVTK